MYDLFKRLFSVTQPIFDCEPSPVEQELEQAMMRTRRTILRSEVQTARSSRMMPSWEDLYLGEIDERGYHNN